MALTKVTSGGIKDGTITNDDIKSDAAITAGKLSATLDLSSKTITLPSASVTAHATTPTLDSPSITGTLFVDDGSTVSHTISNWSDDITYVITPTNCTVGSVNSSGVFVVTHTSGTPSYTIKATTDSLGLADSSLVTKNIVMNLSAPTISSPADTTVTTNVVYTVTSTDSNDDKIILDMGTSNFTYQSVDVGSGSKVGNTVEVTGFTTGNPAITVQFTALGTYASVKAKSTKIDGTYGDSDYSSTDSILIYEQLSAPSLNAPADSDDATAVTYTISSIDSNATKVIFDAQSSNFTYGSVGSGSGSKVGNTVEITGWTGTSVTVTLTYTTAATYSNRANVTSTSATYTDSAWSSTDSIVISASAVDISYLVVAGGGGGGNCAWDCGYSGGGGGAGGYRNSYGSENSGRNSSTESVLSATVGVTYTTTVGAGGSGGTGHSNNGAQGSSSSISGSGLTTITSSGGGYGGNQSGGAGGNGGAGGGSGGSSGSGGSGTASQGQDGEGSSGGRTGAGGGGGASGGGSGNSGGSGILSNITGSGSTRAGGGAGNAGSGGSGGGGSGRGNGDANTGGGGSGTTHGGEFGGGNYGNAGNGGSGVVILRLATSDYTGTSTGSPSVSTSGSDTILTFNGSGTYTA